MNERLARLSKSGVAVWLDDLSRVRLADGGLEQLRLEKSVVGVTTNPTIFAKALMGAKDAGDNPYASQLRDLANRRIGVEEAVRLLTTYDVRWACDVLRAAYEDSDRIDGRVSIEVDPRLARDPDATLAEARSLWWMVDRPNLYIKIPATVEGLPAITAALAEGISVNATLIFSLERYNQVMEAFLTGLERAAASGRDLTAIGSVASFFVSRVDGRIDQILTELGTPEALAMRGKAAVANAQLAYQQYERTFSGFRWSALAAVGARPQRPLWASTSTKNPEYRDVIYVEELVAPGVVNTMPEATLRGYADHGEIPAKPLTSSYPQAQQVLDDLAQLGVDYQEVVDTLEGDGVKSFTSSWEELLSSVAASISSHDLSPHELSVTEEQR